ncbi:UvrABC system protein C [Paractinoplanes abujensis]|uniref:UvrABC system protein C n=1 Tax=Paractinoplanes abujensis TaxID=882441 RepID=A0A7W7CTQ0_9ACTN|nr:excinuclease ABC subunit UvrC [Actinoplanes abujensis]MBB4694204.1 excinuclease ABC subunit C [Actinoplanes abujensis]GID20581.1 UvrABC system protein C [Actinoplanes abujensis]
MPDPSSYRPATGTIPEAPGVYRFRDQTGRVIYVGKAKNLRNRLNSYFADTWSLHARTQQMVTTAASVDWVTVGTEVEALQLEFSWIKEFDPRFNVKYRDDKSYPFLAVTLNEEFPRLQVMRGAKRKGVRYFGPYSHAWAIRETLDLLLRVFPARTCSAGVFKRSGQIGRPCLLGYIGKCSAPCVGSVTAEQHREIVDDFCDFMGGKTDTFVKRLERDMMAASEELEFERAARLRDDIAALRRAMEKQTVVLGDGTDADVVAFAEDPLEAAVQVFHVRDGRVRGQRGWVVEKVEDLTTGDLVHHFCTQMYGESEGEGDVPRELLVPALPDDAPALADWLSARRGTSRVSLRVPQRGDKRALMETVARNAGESLQRHKLRRAGDLTTRSKALDEIAEALGLDTAPLRIECFDVSQIQGTDVVASMVVFEDGLARKSEYRRFAVRGNPDGSGTDDLSAMSEVMRRRFARFRAQPGADAPRDRPESEDAPDGSDAATWAETAPPAPAQAADEIATNDLPGIDPLTGRPRRFAYPPQLVVVDGGQPQVNAVAAVLSDLGITDVALCGLAKRLEEVWLPGDDFPVILPRTSEALYLLQRVRDEAHRFAITFHRQRRSKRMTASALDNVPGLGETRRKALLRHFGSLKRLSAATPEEITEVPGIGRRTAEALLAALNPDAAKPTTGGDEPDSEGSAVGAGIAGSPAVGDGIAGSPVGEDGTAGSSSGDDGTAGSSSGDDGTAGSSPGGEAATSGTAEAMSIPVGGAGRTKAGANRSQGPRPGTDAHR